MKDILARSPKLDDIVRKAANRLGENHGLTRDAHGAVIDNHGNSTRYVGSGGQHPSQLNKPKTATRQGWYKTLSEDSSWEESDNYGKDMGHDDDELYDLKHDDGSHVHIKDLEDDIHYDHDHDDGIDEDYEDESEMGEATGAASAGGYVGPIFGELTESIIREEISKKVRLHEKDKLICWRVYNNKGVEGENPDGTDQECCTRYLNFKGNPNHCMSYGECWKESDCGVESADNSSFDLQESLKNRLIRNVLNEKDYFEGKLKYEKPTKSPGASKNTPGVKETESTLKKSKKDNKEYLKQFDKKIKEYLDFEGNSNPEFPHQNNSKTDYKSPMYRNSAEDEEFIDDFRGMGLQDANGVENLDRIDDYLNGSTKTGNSQDAANVVPSKLGKKMKKTMKSKKKKIAARKAKMTNLRGMTPDVQTVTKESAPNVYIVEQQKEMDKIKHLFNYTDTTQ